MAEAIAGTRGTKRKPDHAPAATDASLQFERRHTARARARGQGVATFIEPDGRLWLTRVTLLDRSDSGLGVRVPVPVSTSATFTLSMDGSAWCDQGVVAHAVARGGSFRLGLRCARRMAA